MKFDDMIYRNASISNPNGERCGRAYGNELGTAIRDRSQEDADAVTTGGVAIADLNMRDFLGMCVDFVVLIKRKSEII